MRFLLPRAFCYLPPSLGLLLGLALVLLGFFHFRAASACFGFIAGVAMGFLALSTTPLIQYLRAVSVRLATLLLRVR